jgi:hypothetical protein
MRIIEIINLSMQYNELLVKFQKGYVWLENDNVPIDKKKEFTPKMIKLLDDMDIVLKKLNNVGVTFRENEIIEVLEIPKQLKRKDVEIYLEDYYKINYFKKEKDKEKEYKQLEREGMKLY